MVLVLMVSAVCSVPTTLHNAQDIMSKGAVCSSMLHHALVGASRTYIKIDNVPEGRGELVGCMLIRFQDQEASC